MKAHVCRHAWGAEAIEDRQLVGDDRDSFERHAATCAICTREIAALAHLRETMRACGNAPPRAIDLRRMRVAVLQGAHRERPSGATRARAAVAMAAAVAVIALLVWGTAGRLWNRPSSRNPPAMAGSVSDPSFEVANVSGAVVTRESSGGVARPKLTDGEAAFHVEHLVAGQRFLLELPDGEIEVHGTRFVVRVRSGRTESVEVTEGSVSLRMHDGQEQLLRAGDRWKLPASAVGMVMPSSSLVATPSTPSPVVAPEMKPPVSGASTGSRHTASASPTSTRISLPRAEANERFEAAVAAFRSGHFADADRLLGAFARDYPSDARCEDTSFLRAVSRSRLGDAAGAADLARAYLARYPQGLRRHEAERLAGSVSP
jgi:ferric-dicitrate binding protein FerR (iron transport regulator)